MSRDEEIKLVLKLMRKQHKERNALKWPKKYYWKRIY